MKHKKKIEWNRLDNASKIFPATYSEKDTKVFRIACELYEKIEPEILQEALSITIEDFPFYKSVLRRGMFWYYFESSDIQPIVQVESNSVCAPIYVGHRYNLLFRVFYYNKRINFEVFHALSDGTGAVWFMQSLVYNYLNLKHKGTFANTVLPNDISSINGKMDDSFKKYFASSNIFVRRVKYKGKQRSPKAYRIGGTKLEENRTNLVEGSMSTKAILNYVNEYNTTVTIFIASLLIYSIYKEMPIRKKKYPVVLSIPINLRPFFKSETGRNFFTTMNVGYPFDKGAHDLADVIRVVSESFKRNLTEEQLEDQLNQFMFWERNPFTRVSPLQIKDFVLRIISKVNDRKITSNISNLGQISMPLEFSSYIRQFSFCTGAKRPQISMCSYNDVMVISFTSPFRETSIQRIFFQMLSEHGIEIEISSNL